MPREARVPADHAAEGTALTFSVPFGAVDARVMPMPFYDPKKALAKSRATWPARPDSNPATS